MRVTIEASTANPCNVETAYYLIFIYVLINRVLRIIDYIASNLTLLLKVTMQSVKNKAGVT